VKIVIIGQGYVGSALAIASAKAGHNVIGFDSAILPRDEDEIIRIQARKEGRKEGMG
jgi:UDP-N-acetyl-D-mannosaminuronate dehydrogenase